VYFDKESEKRERILQPKHQSKKMSTVARIANKFAKDKKRKEGFIVSLAMVLKLMPFCLF